MKIGIIVAMEKEFVHLRKILEEPKTERKGNIDFVCGEIGAHQIIMMQSGMGKVNATIGVSQLIFHYNPELVVSTGVAGGADIEMNPMDVIVSTDCVYHDVYCGENALYGQMLGLPPRFVSPKALVDKALELKKLGNICAGTIVTGDWFVDDVEKMREILSHFPEAKAVDMESCAIAHTCHISGIPFISFRIISDIPLKDTKASQYFSFWDRMADQSFNITKNFIQSIETI